MSNFRLWQALGHYLELADDAQTDGSLIHFLIKCLKTSRNISLKSREARFGAYLAEYPLNLASGASQVLKAAFPEDTEEPLSQPIWLEYDFGDWTPPSNLLRKDIPDPKMNKAELYGFKTTFNLWHGSRCGHLFFHIKEGGSLRLACFSAFILKNDGAFKIGTPSFSPVITLIDTEALRLLQNDLCPQNKIDMAQYEKIKSKMGFENDIHMVSSALRERYHIEELRQITADLAKGDPEKTVSQHKLQMHLSSLSTLAALAALAASQCKFRYWDKMPGYVRPNSYMEYQTNRCALKWKNRKFERPDIVSEHA